ncbi:Histidine phosphatase superfamily (branch 1) [Noviherbaspirillum humi]|uniref:Histidine phosphatase superfamily (Branch 1) n=1 Tax=Noviherbaspirillum humi TaxID=1688639 RepID=A0A239HD79_9BURK|nr:histidine phosphatase family protein [Noviherbaspirillum humi]SNS79396.1 Histidine phosphatase superfamily (branch 1) [Noviherbaspirillum humi]
MSHPPVSRLSNAPFGLNFVLLRRPWAALLFVLALFAAGHPVEGRCADNDALWTALRQGGHAIFIRHASTTPGIGDPPGFILDRCDTQRNLSPQGRAEAARIGETLRRRQVPIAEVYSSRWCRCLDTAKLALGKVTPAPMLDSMFNDPGKRSDEEKTREVLATVARIPAAANVVFVTHAQNIQHMLDVSPAPGEMVLAKPVAGTLRVVGRIALE